MPVLGNVTKSVIQTWQIPFVELVNGPPCPELALELEETLVEKLSLTFITDAEVEPALAFSRRDRDRRFENDIQCR